MRIDHLQPHEIQSYLNKELDEITEELFINHLGECEICLNEVERSWSEHPGIGRIDQERISRRLFQKINQTNLIGNFIKLSVKGFMYLMVGLLIPFPESKASSKA